MRIWLVGLLAACSGEVEGEPETTSAINPDAKVPPGQVDIEAMLKQPPPPLEGHGKVTESVAQHYQVGLFRCPIRGGGRLKLQYGLERDRYWQMGPLWDMEMDPAVTPTWDPIFDEVTAEANWLTGLAMPGTTRSWARSRNDITYEFEHAPAVAGGTVTCTAVRELPKRTVKAKVTGPKPFSRDAFLAHCADIDDVPIFADKEGVLETTMPVPCVVWVEQPGLRSQKIRVDAGDAPLELAFALEPDPLQLPEGGWSPEGKAKAEANLAAVRQRWTETGQLVEKLKEQFGNDEDANKSVLRLGHDNTLFGRRIDRAEFVLNPPANQPQPVAPPPVMVRQKGQPAHP